MAVSSQSFWRVREAQTPHSDVLGFGGSSVRKSLEKWLADPTMRQPLLFRVRGHTEHWVPGMVLIAGAGAEATTELVSMWVGQRMGVWELLTPMVASLLPVALHTGDLVFLS